MLVIRLTRKGKKNQPFFRVVVIDKRSSTRGGRAVEDLGYVDPLKKRKSLNKERIQYWLSKGAKASETMHNLLVAEKITEGKKIHVSKLSTKAKEKIKAEADAKASESKKVEEVTPAVEAPKEEPVAESTPEEAKPAE